jgi:hypothetical protein
MKLKRETQLLTPMQNNHRIKLGRWAAIFRPQSRNYEISNRPCYRTVRTRDNSGSDRRSPGYAERIETGTNQITL